MHIIGPRRGDPYKVWTRDPDGEPGTLLLRTGSGDNTEVDVEYAEGGPAQIAALASDRRGGLCETVLVKNFATDRWYTVDFTNGIITVLDGRRPV